MAPAWTLRGASGGLRPWTLFPAGVGTTADAIEAADASAAAAATMDGAAGPGRGQGMTPLIFYFSRVSVLEIGKIVGPRIRGAGKNTVNRQLWPNQSVPKLCKVCNQSF